MAVSFCLFALACLSVAAGQASPNVGRFYAQQAPAPAHLQNAHPLEYFSESNPEVANYYSQQQKQGSGGHASPARLETLEPDSEVELIPGAQQPQQPTQQSPVAPNLPGLVPGQRVFIVHMPVAGYRPGSIGGYQPVYIVAAAPQGNTGYAANGYQNAILLNPAGQPVSPAFGYQTQGYQPQVLQGQGFQPQGFQQPGFQPQGFQQQGFQQQGFQQQGFPGYQPQGYQGGAFSQAGPGGLLVGGPGNLPFRSFQQAYNEPFGFNPTGGQGQLTLSNLVQGPPAHPANSARNSNEGASDSQVKRGETSASNETKESAPEQRRSARPAQRNKL